MWLPWLNSITEKQLYLIPYWTKLFCAQDCWGRAHFSTILNPVFVINLCIFSTVLVVNQATPRILCPRATTKMVLKTQFWPTASTTPLQCIQFRRNWSGIIHKMTDEMLDMLYYKKIREEKLRWSIKMKHQNQVRL